MAINDKNKLEEIDYGELQFTSLLKRDDDVKMKRKR